MKFLSVLFAFAPYVGAVPAAPWAFSTSQPNGLPVPLKQRLHGNPGYHYSVAEQEVLHYTTTVDQSDGYIVFAELDSNGYFAPSEYVVGINETSEIEGVIPLGLQESEAVRTAKCNANDWCSWHKNNNGLSGSSPPSGNFKNLVLPFRFSDHKHRDLKIETLAYDTFNDDHISVKDFFEGQSFGKLTMDNIFAMPVDISKNETFCADNVSGTSKRLVEQCLSEVITKNEHYNFDEYNIITFIHSGYGAEIGDRDRDGVYYDDRIWSHAREISADGKKMRYALTSAYFGIDGFKIQRVGIPIHEIAQAMGAPTLYGPYPGFGVGYYDPLASPYGFDGTLHHPGCLSAYTRVFFEWADVYEISEDGAFTIEASNTSNKVYKISRGFPNGEYLYIENRASGGYDKGMRGPGLAIYHIDETATNIASSPADADYPANHYRVSLIQADGRFDLELMEGEGNNWDLFNHDKVNGVTPNGPLVNGVLDATTGLFPGYPTTQAYEGGHFVDSGVEITDVSLPGMTMTFKVKFTIQQSS